MIFYWGTPNGLMIIWSHKEWQVQNSIIQYIHIIGGKAWRINSWSVKIPGRNGKMYTINLCEEWTPDVFACIKGRFVSIEVKRDEEEVRKRHMETQKRYEGKNMDRRAFMQQRRWEEIQDAGWLRCIACSCEEVEKFLRENNILT